MATIVSRLKGGGSCNAFVGHSPWWVLDGPPIMEELVEPILDRSIPSIEQLKRVVQWGNMIRMRGNVHFECAAIICLLLDFEERGDAAVSALLWKSVR